MSSQYQHLTEATVLRLAAQYGFEPTDRDVIDNAKQADSYHGQPATIDTSGTKDGRWNAERLLDGYLSQIAHERDCDSRSARAFEDAAYGRD